MQFTYEGFTQNGDTRRFAFRGKSAAGSIDTFYIEVQLILLVENRVPVQEAPSFCLKLLEEASLAEPGHLDRFHQYRIHTDDLRPLLVEREQRLAAKAIKAAARKPFRKPGAGSNLILGARP